MSRRPYLLFSSVGDAYDQAFLSWTRQNRDFQHRSYDVAFVYYGDSPKRYAELAARADRSYWSKGSKFQNLVKYLDALAALEYRYVWAVDDDLALDPAGIDRLFRITRDFGLAASQPALSRHGEFSHGLTLARPGRSLLRYTNFVEINCPVLSSDTLKTLIPVIRPHMDLLTCWGIDILLAHHVWSPGTPFAVIDAVTVRNPPAREKRSGRRECERLGSDTQLYQRWLAARDRWRSHRPPAEVMLAEFGSVRQRRFWE